MNDIGIFIFGSVLFIGLAWAMIAFGLTRFAELQQQDMQTSTTPSDCAIGDLVHRRLGSK